MNVQRIIKIQWILKYIPGHFKSLLKTTTNVLAIGIFSFLSLSGFIFPGLMTASSCLMLSLLIRGLGCTKMSVSYFRTLLINLSLCVFSQHMRGSDVA